MEWLSPVEERNEGAETKRGMDENGNIRENEERDGNWRMEKCHRVRRGNDG